MWREMRKLHRFWFNVEILRRIFILPHLPKEPTRQEIYGLVIHCSDKRYPALKTFPLRRITSWSKRRPGRFKSRHLDIKTLDRHLRKLHQRGYIFIAEKRPKTYRLTDQGQDLLFRAWRPYEYDRVKGRELLGLSF